MGQAKQRGTPEQRQIAAIERETAKQQARDEAERLRPPELRRGAIGHARLLGVAGLLGLSSAFTVSSRRGRR